MPLLKVKKSAQITIPLELRKRLQIAEGDYFEASLLPEGILLKPVALKHKKPTTANPADWETQFQNWADSHKDINAVVFDDSRAAIYGDDER
jgi:AbrB family looped-hinge helix DNA binding protein